MKKMRSGFVRSVKLGRKVFKRIRVLDDCDGPIHPLRLCIDVLGCLGEKDILVVDGGISLVGLKLPLIFGLRGDHRRCFALGLGTDGDGPSICNSDRATLPQMLFDYRRWSLGLAPDLH